MQASYGAIEVSIARAAAVEIARWLDQPNWGYARHTDAHCLDAQAGLELAEITLLGMLASSNLSHGVGYQSFGEAASLEQVVATDEVISINRRLLAGDRRGRCDRCRWRFREPEAHEAPLPQRP